MFAVRGLTRLLQWEVCVFYLCFSFSLSAHFHCICESMIADVSVPMLVRAAITRLLVFIVCLIISRATVRDYNVMMIHDEYFVPPRALLLYIGVYSSHIE